MLAANASAKAQNSSVQAQYPCNSGLTKRSNEAILMQAMHDYFNANLAYLSKLSSSQLESLQKQVNEGTMTESEAKSVLENTFKVAPQLSNILQTTGGELMVTFRTQAASEDALAGEYRNMLQSGQIQSIVGGYTEEDIVQELSCALALFLGVVGAAGTAAAGCASVVGCVGGFIGAASMIGLACDGCC